MKSVVMRTCYGMRSRSKQSNLLTYKYGVITGQCTVCDIREKVLLIFITLLSQTSLVDFYVFFSFFCFSTLLCIVYIILMPGFMN